MVDPSNEYYKNLRVPVLYEYNMIDPFVVSYPFGRLMRLTVSIVTVRTPFILLL